MFRGRGSSSSSGPSSGVPAGNRDRQLAALIAIATIPGALLGALFAASVEDTFERPVLAALLLGVTGWALLSAESHYEERKEKPRPESALNVLDATLIGFAQATAMLPGISRSGTTIATGLWRGIDREAAREVLVPAGHPDHARRDHREDSRHDQGRNVGQRRRDGARRAASAVTGRARDRGDARAREAARAEAVRRVLLLRADRGFAHRARARLSR